MKWEIIREQLGRVIRLLKLAGWSCAIIICAFSILVTLSFGVQFFAPTTTGNEDLGEITDFTYSAGGLFTPDKCVVEVADGNKYLLSGSECSNSLQTGKHLRYVTIEGVLLHSEGMMVK